MNRTPDNLNRETAEAEVRNIRLENYLQDDGHADRTSFERDPQFAELVDALPRAMSVDLPGDLSDRVYRASVNEIAPPLSLARIGIRHPMWRSLAAAWMVFGISLWSFMLVNGDLQAQTNQPDPLARMIELEQLAQDIAEPLEQMQQAEQVDPLVIEMERQMYAMAGRDSDDPVAALLYHIAQPQPRE